MDLMMEMDRLKELAERERIEVSRLAHSLQWRVVLGLALLALQGGLNMALFCGHACHAFFIVVRFAILPVAHRKVSGSSASPTAM
jgi:hypothetical protein